MKKVVTIFALLATVATLSACGGKGGNPDDTTPQITAGDPTVTTSETPSAPVTGAVGGHTLRYRDFTLVLGGCIEEMLAALGEPENISQEESCAFRGYDYTFLYPDIEVSAFSPDGETRRILGINLMTDLISTSEGVELFMEESEVSQQYGTPTEVAGAGGDVLRYSKDGMSLEFLIEDGVVIEIFYHYDDSREFRIDL
jgi:predicted small lipoprotein YifL